jgi:hypothetical protein
MGICFKGLLGLVLCAFAAVPVGCGASASMPGGGGSGGTAGTNAGACPAKPPPLQAYAGDLTCPAAAAAPSGCEYTFNCQNGSAVPFRFSCAPGAAWKIESTPCSQPYDFCSYPQSDARVRCVDGYWSLVGGSDPPAPCPPARPSTGDACFRDPAAEQATCGYWCNDGKTWTVAVCVASGDGKWKLDNACPGS